MELYVETRYGYCKCGCGEKTKPAPRTTTRKGWKKGEPMRCLSGHKEHHIVERDTGYTTPCYIWIGTKDRYARFRLNGVHILAHRYFYEKLVGPIPEGYEIDHLCRVHHCVRVEHLEPVLHRENVRRGALTRLSEEDYEDIACSWESAPAIAARYGLSVGYVNQVRKKYRHLNTY